MATIRRRRFPVLVRKWEYDPDQLRDYHGRWAPDGDNDDAADRRAKGLLDRAKQAEPRITGDLQRISSAAGGKMEGLDFRLKSHDSLARKIASDAVDKQISHRQAAAGIKDAVRYTTVFSNQDYATSVRQALAALKRRGYTIVQIKNYWGAGDPYQGINAVLRSPTGQTFEWQFHTSASYHLKEIVQHPLYERQRVSRDARERFKLYHRMTRNAGQVPSPGGAGSLGDVAFQAFR